MDLNVRAAKPADVPAMLGLVRELAIFEREPEAVTVSEQYMLDAGFGDNPVWWGWVAEKNAGGEQLAGDSQVKSDVVSSSGVENEIIGIAMCYERYSTWRGRVLYLEDIVVTKDARGNGIGEELFQRCAAHAIEKKYHHMTWQVLDWNEGAIRFYERLGADLSGEWLNGSMGREQLKAILTL